MLPASDEPSPGYGCRPMTNPCASTTVLRTWVAVPNNTPFLYTELTPFTYTAAMWVHVLAGMAVALV